MTVDRMLLRELLEKGSDSDLLKEMMTFVVNRMMDLDVESLAGAAHGERSAARTNQRNGYRERPWETRVGRIPIAIPKLRKGNYFPSFLEPAHVGEGARRHHPGGPRAGHLDALGRRPVQSHGHDGHLQKPSLAAVRRHRGSWVPLNA
jgi:Transposase, Mutator family